MRWIEYRCDITDKLDELSKLGKYGENADEFASWIRHYILLEINRDWLSIRVPGGTVGGLHIKDNKIEKIKIDTDYVVKTYDKNVNTIINDLFVGTEFDVDKYIVQKLKDSIAYIGE